MPLSQNRLRVFVIGATGTIGRTTLHVGGVCSPHSLAKTGLMGNGFGAPVSLQATTTACCLSATPATPSQEETTP